MIELKTDDQLQIMREGGALLARIRDEVLDKAEAGVTTLELNDLAERLMKQAGAKSNFKGYGGFPFVICARLNKKEAILEAFPHRLKNTAEEEIRAALEEIYKIAYLRLQDIFTQQ